MTVLLAPEGVEEVVPRVNVRVDWFDAESGEKLRTEEVHNLVVSAGLNLLRDAINTGTTTAVTHFAVGTGSAAVVAGNTTLGTEVYRDALNSKTPNPQQLVCHYYLTAASANGSTLREAGLFTAGSGGTLYARVVLATPIVKTASVAVAFTWTLSWGAV